MNMPPPLIDGLGKGEEYAPSLKTARATSQLAPDFLNDAIPQHHLDLHLANKVVTLLGIKEVIDLSLVNFLAQLQGSDLLQLLQDLVLLL